MPSPLGKLLRSRRQELGIGLRELARRLDKAPAVLTRLENEEIVPAIAPETLRALARELALDEDRVLVLAQRTEEMAPRTELEVAIYRSVRRLSPDDQRKLLKGLQDS